MKRIMTALLAALFAVAIITSCGNDTSEGETTSDTGEKDTTVITVTEDNVDQTVPSAGDNTVPESEEDWGVIVPGD